jgi:hypothetical protein
LSWRWLYWILSIPAGLNCVLLYIFLPETRFVRSIAELSGDTSHLPSGQDRPELDLINYENATWTARFIVQKADWKAAKHAAAEILLVGLFPNILWVILINSIGMAIFTANQMTSAPILLRPPFSWSEDKLGYASITVFIGAVLSFIVSGVGGDYVALLMTKLNKGIREPEHQLFNFIIPILSVVIGSALFGLIAEHPYGFKAISLLTIITLINFGFWAINSVSAVYAIECHPKWAG